MSAAKSIPVSVRLTQTEADFIARFNTDGAVTPSEKVRAIIRLAKERSERPSDFGTALRIAQDLMAPATETIRVNERIEKSHSELLALLLDWLPQVLAVLMSTRVQSAQAKTDLVAVEAELAELCFRLFSSLLRLGVTESSPCYDEKIIRNNLEPVLNLAHLILDTQTGESDHA